MKQRLLFEKTVLAAVGIFGATFVIFAVAWLFSGCKNKPVEPVVPPPMDTTPAYSNNWHCSTIEPGEGAKRAVGLLNSFWPVGTVLHVQYMGGTVEQRKWPTQAFKVLEAVVNLKFDFPVSGPYDVRISFDPNKGSYSYIGTGAKNIPQNTNTINLGWSGLDVSLHEISHHIGLLHEMSSPVSNICWNKEQVYADLAKQGWSKQMVESNVFFKYNSIDVLNTEFDPISIMEYQVPGSWTCSGVGIPGGKVLSEKDKFLLAKIYPGVVVPPPPPPAPARELPPVLAAPPAPVEASPFVPFGPPPQPAVPTLPPVDPFPPFAPYPVTSILALFVIVSVPLKKRNNPVLIFGSVGKYEM